MKLDSGNILLGMRSPTEGREGMFQDDSHAPGLEMSCTNSPDTNFLC